MKTWAHWHVDRHPVFRRRQSGCTTCAGPAPGSMPRRPAAIDRPPRISLRRWSCPSATRLPSTTGLASFAACCRATTASRGRRPCRRARRPAAEPGPGCTSNALPVVVASGTRWTSTRGQHRRPCSGSRRPRPGAAASPLPWSNPGRQSPFPERASGGLPRDFRKGPKTENAARPFTPCRPEFAFPLVCEPRPGTKAHPAARKKRIAHEADRVDFSSSTTRGQRPCDG